MLWWNIWFLFKFADISYIEFPDHHLRELCLDQLSQLLSLLSVQVQFAGNREHMVDALLKLDLVADLVEVFLMGLVTDSRCRLKVVLINFLAST